jgi:hypothetical protein
MCEASSAGGCLSAEGSLHPLPPPPPPPPPLLLLLLPPPLCCAMWLQAARAGALSFVVWMTECSPAG